MRTGVAVAARVDLALACLLVALAHVGSRVWSCCCRAESAHRARSPAWYQQGAAVQCADQCEAVFGNWSTTLPLASRNCRTGLPSAATLATIRVLPSGSRNANSEE